MLCGGMVVWWWCTAQAPFRSLIAPSRAVRSVPAVPVRAMSTRPLSPLLNTALEKSDPEMFDIIEKEKQRQRDSLALIPSEVSPSSACCGDAPRL